MKTRFEILLAAALVVLAPFARAQLPIPETSLTVQKTDESAPHSSDADSSSDNSEDAPEMPAKAHRHRSHSGDDQVTIFSGNSVRAGETVTGNAVAVGGTLAIDGTVDGDAVSVMGGTTINGTVHGCAVSVLGDLTLGPDAKVDGDTVCVGGSMHRAAGAIIGGEVVHQSFGDNVKIATPLKAWWLHGHRLAWVWIMNLLILAFYAFVALVFPKGIRRCGDMLVQRPGLSILSAVLAVLAFPILFVLLLVSIIGIPIALLVPVALAGLAMFGKASFYALIGRTVTRDRVHPSAAVMVGGLICLVFFMIPVVGMLLSLFLSFLCMGCSIAAIFTSTRRGATPPTEPPPPVAAAVSEPPVAAQPVEAPAPPAATTPIPPELREPPIAVATLPRAGFWIRMGALFIDLLLVGVAFGPIFSHYALLILALYGAVMWKFKGTTIGGIICGLKIVRLDERPIDWPTAVVRALSCFLSLIAVGLGFVWVAFDPQRQAWHDKIAGTIVVRTSRSRPLV